MDVSAPLITAVIITALIGGFILHLVADVLNMARLKQAPPEEFKTICDPAQYRKLQNYVKENTRFGIISAAFDLIVLLAFWFSHGFRYLDEWLRTLDAGNLVTGLLFIGILLFARLILGLPFSWWSTFVIEEKYGFNQTDARTFAVDTVKTVGLSIVFGAPILSAILLFLEHGGKQAWIWCWTAAALFLLLVQYIVPTWIMPLFNTFTPMEESPLRQRIMAYARAIDFPLTNIFIMDGSRRSTKANAFFTGFGSNKRIVLYDTLIRDHTDDELLAVLAHEMGHFKKRHIQKRVIAGIIQMGIMFWLLSVCISFSGLFEAFFITRPSVYAGLVFFGLLYSPADLVISIFMQMSSRKDEFDADTFAVQTSRRGNDLIQALKKLSVSSLANLTPHPFYVFLNCSHPPVVNRIQVIRQAMARSG